MSEKLKIKSEDLGSKSFQKTYNCKWSYYAGSMVRGIASVDMVVRLAKAKILSFFGSAGYSLTDLEDEIKKIQKQIPYDAPYGMCLLANLLEPEIEKETVELFFKYNINKIEASAFSQITPSIVYYRLKGIYQDKNTIVIPNKVIGKISRPEVASLFLSPPPESIVKKLVEEGLISPKEAELAKKIPMADDITAEANSGGHTDAQVSLALIPVILKMRDDFSKEFGYQQQIRVGAAGGLGLPQAVAAAFMMGVDYVVTGSVNQCTVEAGISDIVKDMLNEANVQDTVLAPAGDMFEIGAKVQLLSKGVFFPARANKLYDLYRNYNSLDEIDEKTKDQIENKYFKKSFANIWDETREYWQNRKPEEVEKAEANPKHKMALIFRWYFGFAMHEAMVGNIERKVDFQIYTGPAMGSFNQWVKGTKYEDWHERNVDEIAGLLMNGASIVFNYRYNQLNGTAQTGQDLSKELAKLLK